MRRHARHRQKAARRAGGLIVIAFVVTLAAVPEAHAASALTVTTELTLPEALPADLNGFYMAAVGSDAHGPAPLLGVAWSRVPLGWFGDVWGLQLAVAPELAQGVGQVKAGTGYLAGTFAVELRNVNPAWGHTYETRLTYDAAFGTVGVTVVDRSAGTVVYDGGLDLRPLSGGKLTVLEMPSPVGYETLEVQEGFIPSAVPWRILQREGASLSAPRTLNRRAETVVRLAVPWAEMPGSFTLTAHWPGGHVVLAHTDAPGKDADIPVEPHALAQLPAGETILTGTYTVDGRAVVTMSEAVAVGRLATRIADLRLDREAGLIEGTLYVAADGPVPGVTLTVEAVFGRLLRERDHVGVPHLTSLRLARERRTYGPEELGDLAASRALALTFPLPEPIVAARPPAEFSIELSVTAAAAAPVSHDTQAAGVSFLWGTPVYTVDPSVTYQVIDGFGASGAWWAQHVGRVEGIRDQIADLLFSPVHGIGLSLYRYHAGAGIEPLIRDPWRTAETFEVNQGVYDWERDPGGRWFLQAAKARGVDNFTLIALSPPRRITANGRSFADQGASSNLPPGKYEEYATYLADILQHFAEAYGIRFSTVSPLNEPEWDWSGGGTEGSQYSLEEIIALGRVIARKLEEAGLETELLLPEAGDWAFIDGAGRAYADALLRDPELGSRLSVLAVHSYWSTDTDRLAAAQKMAEYPGVRLWMTEWCEMRSGRDLGMDQALNLARTVHADLTLGGVSAWTFWLAVSRHDYRDGLIYIAPDYTSYQTSKAFWALGNFSRFIRPGARRIDVQESAPVAPPLQPGVAVSAFLSADGEQVIVVAINELTTATPVELAVRTDVTSAVWTPYRTSASEDLAPGEPFTVRGADGTLRATVTLAPQSVTTFVIDLER